MADEPDCCEPTREELEEALRVAEAGRERWKRYGLALHADVQSIFESKCRRSARPIVLRALARLP